MSDLLEKIEIRWVYEERRRKTFHPSPRWAYSQARFGGVVPQIGDTINLNLPVQPEHSFLTLEDEKNYNHLFSFRVVNRTWLPDLSTVRIEVDLDDPERFWNLPQENLSRLKAEWNTEG